MAQYSLNTPYLLLTGALLIAVMLGAVVYKPMYDNWQAARQETAQAQKTLTERQQFLASIDQKKAELNQLQQYENELAVVLPNEDRLDDIYRILHQAGVTSGVLINSLDNTSDRDQAAVNNARNRGEAGSLPQQVLPVGISMEIRGTYQQLRSFMDILDKTPRLVKVTALDSTRDITTPDQLVSKIQVQFFKRDVISQ